MDPLLKGMLQNPVLNRRCAELQNETHMSSWGPRPILSRTEFNILRSCSRRCKRPVTCLNDQKLATALVLHICVTGILQINR